MLEILLTHTILFLKLPKKKTPLIYNQRLSEFYKNNIFLEKRGFTTYKII